MKSLCIIGDGDLGKALYSYFEKVYDVEIVSRTDCDFLIKNDILVLSKKISQKDIVICTVGTFNENDTWNSYIVNSVAPSFLIKCMMNNNSLSHFIHIGSHGSTWNSWPGISIERVNYNNSKRSIHDFILSLSHSGLTDMKLSIIHPTKFQSKMSNYSGYDINDIIKSIEHVINSNVSVIVYEIN